MMGTINSRWLLMATVVALVLVAALPLSAGPVKNKATGSVEWTNYNGKSHLYTEFALHDRDGTDVQGSYYYQEADTDTGDGFDLVIDYWMAVEIDCVVVSGNTAKWSGHISDSSVSGDIGKAVHGKIADNATPGADGDRIGSSNPGGSDVCVDGTFPTTVVFPLGGTVTSGNLTVFFDDDV